MQMAPKHVCPVVRLGTLTGKAPTNGAGPLEGALLGALLWDPGKKETLGALPPPLRVAEAPPPEVERPPPLG